MCPRSQCSAFFARYRMLSILKLGVFGAPQAAKISICMCCARPKRGQPAPPPLAALSGSRNFSRVKGPFSLGAFSRVKREGRNFSLLGDQRLVAAAAPLCRCTGAFLCSFSSDPPITDQRDPTMSHVPCCSRTCVVRHGEDTCTEPQRAGGHRAHAVGACS